MRDVLGILIRRERPRAWIRFCFNKFERREVTGAEIGVCEGYNARDIMDNLNIKELYLIDPYEEYKDLNDLNPQMDWAEKKARRMLYKYEHYCKWIKKYSANAVKEIPMVDFVYIDGNHAYNFVKEDIKLYWNKLNEGGVLAGHDIENGNCQEHDGVTKAVINFAVANKLKLYIHAPDWWIVK